MTSVAEEYFIETNSNYDSGEQYGNTFFEELIDESNFENIEDDAFIQTEIETKETFNLDIKTEKKLNHYRAKCGEIYMENNILTYVCDFCEIEFPNPEILQYHLYKRHLIIEIPIYLDACILKEEEFYNKKFPFERSIWNLENPGEDEKESINSDEDNLQNDKVDDEMHSCCLCKETFEKFQYLKYHLNKVHRNPKIVKEIALQDNNGTIITGKKRDIFFQMLYKGDVIVDGLFKCKICNSSFKKRRYLRDHLKYIHAKRMTLYQIDEFNTNDNDEFFQVTNDSIRVPASMLIEDFNVKCENLPEFINEEDKTKYFKNLYMDSDVIVDGLYQCKLCMTNFKQRRYLRAHIKKIHDKNNILQTVENDNDLNEVYIKLEDEMILAREAHKGDDVIVNGLFQCKICKKNFQKRRYLRDHITKVHIKARVYKYECTKCDRKFYDKTVLKYHINAHLKIKPYRCEICKKYFARLHNLKHHMYLHSGIKKFKCQYCDKCFVHQASKQVHERHIHKKEKPFMCSICGSAFFTSTLLKYHNKRHDNIRDYPCTLCGKKFYSNRLLKEHTTTVHTNIRKFSCTYCNKAFKIKKTLSNHMLLHQSNKSYVCKICNKSFAQLPGLYSHNKIHHIL